MVAMALLDGSTTDLRHLVSLLEVGSQEITVSLTTGAVTRKRTASPLLRVSAEADRLTVEGDDGALGRFYTAVMGVADDAESAEDRAIRRHAHIEYLGDDDRWRSADSFPLVVGADWPTS
jgi:hypothetical protein